MDAEDVKLDELQLWFIQRPTIIRRRVGSYEPEGTIL